MRLIVYAWMNGESTLRTYGSRTDAYAVFRGMLDGGDPSDDWEALLAASSSHAAVSRAAELLEELGQAEGPR